MVRGAKAPLNFNMNRKDYNQILKDIELTDEQQVRVLVAIEDLMRTNTKSPMNEYFIAKTDGLNTAYRFFAGTLDEHDEFED